MSTVMGPRSVYRPPEEGIPAPADYPGAPVSRILDASTQGAELFAVLVAISGDIPLHYHPVMELQFVLSGTGLALDADGGETPIGPGGAVLSPAGPAGAHGFRNTGALPLTLLCVYPSPGGVAPGRTPFVLPG
jgi:mannose-6-phosphate isomerase-like protein (cupin superfamily)